MRTFVQRAPVSITIALVCILIWVITVFQSGSLKASSLGSPVAEAMMAWGPLVTHSDWGILRAVTALFLHLDAMHITANVIMLVLVGWICERQLGSGVFLLTYLAGGVFSFYAVFLFDYESPTAGASGALYAMMVVMVAVIARNGGSLRAPILLIVLNVAYSFIASGVSVTGHLGGLVAGLLLAWPVSSPNPRVRQATAVGATVLVIVAGPVIIELADSVR